MDIVFIIIRDKVRLFIAKMKLLKVSFFSKFKDEKRLFIDCGSNVGQGYSFFTRYLVPERFDAIIIEPNPDCMKVLKEKYGKHPNLDFIESAAWIKEEKLTFFGLSEDERGNTSPGASVVASHNGGMYESDAEKAIEVDAFSFSDLLKEKSSEYDKIVVKLDIESSEYTVLKDLLEKETAKYMDHLFVEFHSQFFKKAEISQYQKLEKELVRDLKASGVNVSLWV